MTTQRTRPTEGRPPSHYLDEPGWRMLLRLPVGLWRVGLGPLAGRVWMVVTTTGRSSGLPRHTVVYPHVVGGRTYLWCPYGGRAQWYRNLVAHPVATVQSRRGTHVVRAVPLTDEAEAVGVASELHRFPASFFRSYLASQGLGDTTRTLPRTGGACTSGASSRRRRPDTDDRAPVRWTGALLA